MWCLSVCLSFIKKISAMREVTLSIEILFKHISKSELEVKIVEKVISTRVI